MNCPNCEHGANLHVDGCGIVPCDCPLDFAGVAPCPGKYVIHSGAVVRCAHRAGHPGEHEGYYPGDTHLSHWKEKAVANPDRVKAADTQVGGTHYREMVIQPWEIVDAFQLGFYSGNVLKYLLRAGRKGSRVEDYKKARHYLDKLIENEERDGDGVLRP